jgi:hypothetical protein
MLFSKLGYSELIQRLFEKIAFFLVDPLVTATVTAMENGGRRRRNAQQ